VDDEVRAAREGGMVGAMTPAEAVRMFGGVLEYAALVMVVSQA
jgi:hypothetical protein